MSAPLGCEIGAILRGPLEQWPYQTFGYDGDVDRKTHWNTVFSSKSDHDLSWFESLPRTSVRMLEAAGIRGWSIT